MRGTGIKVQGLDVSEHDFHSLFLNPFFLSFSTPVLDPIGIGNPFFKSSLLKLVNAYTLESLRISFFSHDWWWLMVLLLHPPLSSVVVLSNITELLDGTWRRGKERERWWLFFSSFPSQREWEDCEKEIVERSRRKGFGSPTFILSPSFLNISHPFFLYNLFPSVSPWPFECRGFYRFLSSRSVGRTNLIFAHNLLLQNTDIFALLLLIALQALHGVWI